MGGGGGGISRRADEEIRGIELGLDLAIFEDGLCGGPDERGLFDGLVKDIQQQCRVTQEIVEVLRRGESVGRVFEILRPPAQHAGTEHSSPILFTFANMAVHQLLRIGDAELLEWFEGFVRSSGIALHRRADLRTS